MTKEIKEKIRRMYIDEKLTMKEIAERLNIGKTTVQYNIKKMGLIITHNKSEQSKKDLEEYRNKIVELYNSGLSMKEVGKKLNKSEKTIQYHLSQIGAKIRSTKKIDQKEFERLWNEGKTDEEIAKYFNTSVLTVRTYRTKGKNAGKFNIKRYFSQEEHKLSHKQQQMILGSLLGDMSLTKPSENGSINSRLAIVHSIKQEEYFMKKVEILNEFMGSYRLEFPNPDKRTGKVYKTWRGNSKTHKVFTDIYNVLYINGIKTITEKYLAMIDSPIALAYWFMDDGTNSGVLATNCFSIEEHRIVIEWLKEKWNIIATIQKQPNNQHIIHISSKSRKHFEELIFPYMIPSMYYKLKYLSELNSEVCSKTTVNSGNS